MSPVAESGSRWSGPTPPGMARSSRTHGLRAAGAFGSTDRGHRLLFVKRTCRLLAHLTHPDGAACGQPAARPAARGHLDEHRDRRAGSRAGRSAGSAEHRTGWGCAIGLEKDGRVASCAEVSVGPGGEVTVTRIVTAYECGAIVNPDTVAGQGEGGTIMALGGALFEQVGLDHGRLASPLLAGYRVPRFSDMPAIEVVLMESR